MGGFFRLLMLRSLFSQGRLAWRLFRDGRVPLLTKLVPLGTVLYVVSPLDALPDILLLLGRIDDLTIIVLGLAAFLRLCPYELVEEHRARLMGRNAPASNVVEGRYRVVEEHRAEHPSGSG